MPPTGKTRDSRRAATPRGGAFWRFFRQKFTVMLVPHTEKRTVRFQISLVALIVFSFLFIGLLGGFFWLSLDYSDKEALLSSRLRDLVETEASLDLIRDEIGQLITSAGDFQSSLQGAREVIGIDSASTDSGIAGGGDLASLFAVAQSNGDAPAEINDLQSLRTSLEDSVSTLEDIALLLSSQKDLLSDIPNIWPLKDVRGRVTQVFGPAINPFNKSTWYLHRGVDLAYFYGIPIVATADGKVIEKKHDDGFGFYIDIQHKYGFKTRYAHLQRQLVELGQTVSQGDVIATMGNTGRSTGPHLHYEVMIGTQLVDPIKFLNMANSQSSPMNASSAIQGYH